MTSPSIGTAFTHPGASVEKTGRVGGSRRRWRRRQPLMRQLLGHRPSRALRTAPCDGESMWKELGPACGPQPLQLRSELVPHRPKPSTSKTEFVGAGERNGFSERSLTVASGDQAAMRLGDHPGSPLLFAVMATDSPAPLCCRRVAGAGFPGIKRFSRLDGRPRWHTASEQRGLRYPLRTPRESLEIE